MQTENKIIFWGTYDIGKPRVRLLVQAAQALGYQTVQVHSHVWRGVEDKSQITSWNKKLKVLWHLLLAYPILIVKYWRTPKHKHIVVPYLGLLDVIVLWPWSKLRNAKIHWDVFLSLYDTVVNDRKIISKHHPLAKLLYRIELLASKLATSCFLDTPAHAEYFGSIYKLTHKKISWVPVGVEADNFHRNSALPKIDLNNIKVLFYGQFIPLHGLDTIVNAAKLDLDNDKRINWLIVGKGQLSKQIDDRIAQENISSIRRLEWVDYKKLNNLLQSCDICLGIFGTSNKAKSVIPNKIYQIMAAGKPFVSARTAGLKPLCLEKNIAVRLVREGSHKELLDGIYNLAESIAECPDEMLEATRAMPIVNAEAVASHLDKLFTAP
ncbi:glycosyltransferase [Shewanella aquimarina]|uniref:glycosyltransferase n=1 Tax=Shewanella aquimarina TaxID=260365 RepID=UPI002015011B|nr:glycosyltransferase [Shewanella aquimarina]MCL2912154.1 glycosyltransferase [Shewanella aquimarina]